MNIILLKFNNYYNRQIKVYDTLSSYSSYIVSTKSNVNFNPRDGVTTSQIMNCGDVTDFNYLLVTDDNNEIVSRWFVLDAVRKSAGQYDLSLRRDLIADAYASVINAPMFVEKATLSDTNPLIFNSENMSYNQIKQSELLLKDKSNTAWIVGYMARNDGDGNVTHIEGNVTESSNQYISLTTTSPTNFINSMSGITLRDYMSFSVTYARWFGPFDNYRKAAYYVTPDKTLFSASKDGDNYWDIGGRLTDEQMYNNYFKNHYTDIFETLTTAKSYKTADEYNNALFYDGKQIKLSDGKVYKVSITSTDSTATIDMSTVPTVVEQLDTIVYNYLSSLGYSTSQKKGNPYTNILCNTKIYSCSLQEVIVEGTYNYNIPTSRTKVNDAPYDMFAIPFNPTETTSKVEVYDDDIGGYIVEECPSNIAMLVAQTISEKWGATLYDLQLLPYCPIPALLNQPGSQYINLDEVTENQDYTWITTTGNINKGIIFFPSSSSFSLKITLQNPVVITEVKVQSECDMYRLCSPNYQGIFEFNAAKNGGISSFDVDCTYLPYNPYIHLNPNFGKLYGRDFNDARGLVCSGDFSLARISDAWTNYQLNNKNYMASFNRQIQNLEFNNNMQRIADISNAVTGTATGAIIGGIMVGPAGAIGAGLASGAAGIADLYISEQMRKETLDYTKDQFGYQLGNIKALPDGLSKTTAYTVNNKYFPFLEFYTCTEEEKNALRNKIKYNGMTVMAVGTMNTYIQPQETYIKGKLIRFSDNNYDTHYVEELAKELNLGVFIGGN